MLYYCIKNKLLSSLKNSKNFNGFTLTEVLLAVVIVGIIAALVLPSTVSKFNEKTLDLGYEREVKTISSAVDSLVVSENKKDFFSTMMYTDVEPESYDDTSGKFLKKYLKISKYCGSDASDCFASKYYEYKDNQKKEYTPDYKGSCGRLKNGMSICLTPQIGAQGIKCLIDINGKKGPNIQGRDLRSFVINAKTRTGRITDTTEVLAHNGYIELVPEEPEMPEPPLDSCSIDNNSLDCCKIRTISGITDACCNYEEIKNGNASCHQIVDIALNCAEGSWNSSSADFYERFIYCTTSINPYVTGFQASICPSCNKYNMGERLAYLQRRYKNEIKEKWMTYVLWYNGNKFFEDNVEYTQLNNFHVKYNVTTKKLL